MIIAMYESGRNLYESTDLWNVFYLTKATYFILMPHDTYFKMQKL